MKSYLRLQTLTVVVLIVVSLVTVTSLIGVSCSRMMGSAVLQLELGGNQTYGFYRGIFQQLTTCSLSILQAIGIISPDKFGWIHVLNILWSLCFTCIRSADGVGSSSLGLDAQFTAGRSEIHECHGGSGQKLPASLKKHNCITNRWRTLIHNIF